MYLLPRTFTPRDFDWYQFIAMAKGSFSNALHRMRNGDFVECSCPNLFDHVWDPNCAQSLALAKCTVTDSSDGLCKWKEFSSLHLQNALSMMNVTEFGIKWNSDKNNHKILHLWFLHRIWNLNRLCSASIKCSCTYGGHCAWNGTGTWLSGLQEMIQVMSLFISTPST